MLGSGKQPSNQQVQITMDGHPVELSSSTRASFAAIRAHLETLALKERRILFGLTVDGKCISLSEYDTIVQFKSICAVTISLDEMSRQLLLLAVNELEKLRARVEDLSLVVMINDIKVVEALWWALLPELKTPLLTLSYLPQVLEQNAVQHPALKMEFFLQQTQQFRNLLIDLDALCNRADLLGFSEALEKRLAKWLAEMAHILSTLHAPLQTHNTPQ